MNKFLRLSLCAACAVVLATGCSSSAEEVTEETSPTFGNVSKDARTGETLTDQASIVIGEYKGLETSAERQEVTDSLIQNELDYLCYLYPAEVTDRAAVLGDVANIDYVGYLDGEAFAGGSYEGYDLTLGSGTFIDGFEDGVVGMIPGEQKDIELTFPEDYGSAELAGQDVVFSVTLNHIKDVTNTEVDDSLARRVTGDFSATAESLLTLVEEEMNLQADLNYFNSAGVELANKVIENSEITLDPDAVGVKFDDMYDYYTTYATYYGMDIDAFLEAYMGLDFDGLMDLAKNLVSQEMVLNEIAEREGLVPTDEEKELTAKLNYYDSAADLIDAYGEEESDELFRFTAAYNFLIQNSVPADGTSD